MSVCTATLGCVLGMWIIITTVAVTVKVGRMRGSGCLEDEVGVGVENDEDEVLILVFAG